MDWEKGNAVPFNYRIVDIAQFLAVPLDEMPTGSLRDTIRVLACDARTQLNTGEVFEIRTMDNSIAWYSNSEMQTKDLPTFDNDLMSNSVVGENGIVIVARFAA